jgi:conjugative relaxase-like TrwC/TraI family protein
MFTMAKIKAGGSSFGGGGKSFYQEHLSSNDYYCEHERVKGAWKGRLTDAFDLTGGKVWDREFSLFQRNINPLTGERLTKRTHVDGIRFFDFQCSAQKSVSIMGIVGQDKRLVEAHVRAVEVAMRELERFAAVRVRSGGSVWSNNLNSTGNIIYAQYHHDASRSLDPQLHAHNVVVNCTYDYRNKELRALSEYKMCKAIRYAGKVYQNLMATAAVKCGYEIEKKRGSKGNIEGFEIKGITEEMMKTYSSRRADIEEAAEKFIESEGRSPSTKEMNVIARQTRDRKLADVSTAEVREQQRAKLTAIELKTIEQIKLQAESRKPVQIHDQDKFQIKINDAVAHLFERNSVLTADQILAEVLNQNLGKIDLDVLKKELLENDNLIRLSGDEISPYFASKENTLREIYILDTVSKGKNKCIPLNSDCSELLASVTHQSEEKQCVLQSLLGSKDRFMLFQGSAGVGKTSALHDLSRGIIEGGEKNIILIAPTNSAVAVLKNEGFKQSQTVEKFLHDKRNIADASNGVLVVDESGLNSVRQGAELMNFAEVNNCRIIFVGDVKQHTSVEAGDFFRLLGDYTRVERVELRNIHRQHSDEYKRCVKLIVEGDVEGAFQSFDKKGWILAGKGRYMINAADDFIKFTDGGTNLHKCIAVAPTHREGELITEEIRRQLKNRGIIAGKGNIEKAFESYKWSKAQKSKISNYRVGQEICFIRNPSGQRNLIGHTFKIEKIQDDFILLSNGNKLDVKEDFNFFEVGESNDIELCKGDLITFTVNDKKKGIVNGHFALVDGSRKLKLIDRYGSIITEITLDKNFSAFKYGFVATSHKSQAQTKENVVVAAEKMDQKAFYVATSRGTHNMRLHCPDKSWLLDYIRKVSGNRDAALDLRRDLKEVFNANEKARIRGAELLRERVAVLSKELKDNAGISKKSIGREKERVWEVGHGR